MAKRTDTERIIQYLDRFGVATVRELQDQFNVSDAMIHNLCAREQYPLQKSPRFIMNMLGHYKFWTKTTLRTAEIVTLIRQSNQLITAYEESGREQYKKYSLILARKAVAAALTVLADFEQRQYIDKVHQFSAELEMAANQSVDAVDYAIKYGKPVFSNTLE